MQLYTFFLMKYWVDTDFKKTQTGVTMQDAWKKHTKTSHKTIVSTMQEWEPGKLGLHPGVIISSTDSHV